jgi:hypothetical protein
MDKTIVERAIQALAALNGASRREGEFSRCKTGHAAETQLEASLSGEAADCGMPGCAGCYDVGDGRKIHPPRCGEAFSRWRAWLEGKGQSQ